MFMGHELFARICSVLSSNVNYKSTITFNQRTSDGIHYNPDIVFIYEFALATTSTNR